MTLHLVTGGSGYLGLVLVRELVRRGESVRVLDVADAEDRPQGVELHRADVRDRESVARALDGVDVVHHAVAQVPLAKDREAFWSVNRDGTRVLAEECARARVRKLVAISSSAVYGVPKGNPVRETDEPVPAEEYGRAKLAAEEVIAEHAAKGLDASIVRPRTIMGHGRLGIMQLLFEWIRRGRNVPVMGRGDNVYQFVHAGDLARACLAAADRPGPRSYNVGAAEFGTMRETLEATCGHAGTGSRVVSVPRTATVAGMKTASALGLSPLGAYHSLMYGRSLWFDISRARDELAWEPEHSNADMFCESYDWYLANREQVLARKGASHHRSAVKPGVLELASRTLSLLPAKAPPTDVTRADAGKPLTAGGRARREADGQGGGR